MRKFIITWAFVFLAGLALAWNWGLNHRLSYLSRDYALFTGKKVLIDGYSSPGLAVFGDSLVLDGVRPELLGPGVINCAMNGSTPIESYFLIKRLMGSPARPKAVLLSYNPYHFIHPDFYWDNTVKFGMVSGAEADEVMGRIIALNDRELLTGLGLWDLDQRLHSYLLSRGFPAYYISSLYAEPFGARQRENEEALKVIAQTRGQYFFPQADGSKQLNADTQLKAFGVDPVIDYYFRRTLELLGREGIPAYFYVMPLNESSVQHLDAGMVRDYKAYLEVLEKSEPSFRVLSKPWTVYPWTLFSDYAHLNMKGTLRFNAELARALDRSGVLGGPYGVTR